ncbi:MAG: DUF58 domain-containing protein [Verrucomicrobia bacterium]|nr:DUF58 domain-containing protein [Verrucomicrobiota bacterium]
MPIPTNRLLGWFAMLIPVALLGVAMPFFWPVSLVLYALLAVVALGDFAAARPVLRQISVSLPEVVRLSKDNPGTIPVRIANAGRRALSLLVGVPVPETISVENDMLEVLLPDGAANATVPWSCKPSLRGNFAIDRCYFGLPSPLGLWTLRGSSVSKSELRVYPNMLSERKRLAAIFLNRGNFGSHRHRIVGQGREFEKLREYIPGDSYEDIHWKATAKRGRPVTKLFQVERTQEIYVLIDSSRLSARAAGAETALEHYVTSALTLGLVARQQGDLFGLLSFADKVRRFMRASSGKAHYSACLDAIYTAHSQMVTPDFEDLFAFVRLRMRRRALLVILTDLGDPVLAENFLKNVELICGQHVVLVFSIQPPGIRPLFSEPGADRTDALYGKLGGHLVWQNLKELEKKLHRKGVRLTMTDNDRLSTELVSQYMSIKARQVL